MNRIDRLTAILIQLQTKKIVKAEEIASRFEISLRTVYRDVKALMEAGVPIGSEAGKGYFIVDGYYLPPVMFTQDEAGAMVMAGKLVDSFTDPSIKKAFQSSLLKVKAVLQQAEKNHVADLEDHIEVLPPLATQPITGKFLNEIRNAIVSRKVISLLYTSQYQQETTQREVEPIGLFYYSMSWHLIAWCRLRKGMRDFRTDRIVNLTVKEEQFTPGDIVTLQDYFNSIRENHADMQQVVVVFDRKTATYVTNSRYYFGFVREEYTDEGIRMYFLVGQLPGMARWLLAYADAIEIEEPLSLKETMRNIVQELVQIYLPEVFHSKE
ncbi:MAG: YafY family protein [Cyclobacteriaceae bacterium]|jgi:predicted DNA-binding transcriptional regulator YafY|nr:YafY family transcriptional regulator [Flammeovirgaceae bacterium]MCZ8021801.1 YafY family protein [Cytophagales bacterium]MCZ8328316.1 YafY family protein [Cyclobacteriaceae bacterium]